MLTLTPAAAEVVRLIVADAPIEPTGGLRIASAEETADGTEFQMTLVDAPEESDRELSEAGATIFLDPHAAELLEDKMLDAELDGDEVRFAVVDQDDEEDDYVPSRNGSGPG